MLSTLSLLFASVAYVSATEITYREPTTEQECREAAQASGLTEGGAGFPFVGYYGTQGCYSYNSGSPYYGHAYWSTKTDGVPPTESRYRVLMLNDADMLNNADWGPPGGEMPLTCKPADLATSETRRSLAFIGHQGYAACIAGKGCFMVHMSQSGSWSATDTQQLPWDNGVPEKKLTTIIGWANHEVFFYNEDGDVVRVACGASCTHEIQENWVCPEGEFYASVHCADDTLTIQRGGAPHESSGALIHYEPGQAPTVKVIDYNDSVLHTIQLNCQCDSS